MPNIDNAQKKRLKASIINKITIIGTGSVGSTISYTLTATNIAKSYN